VLGSSEENGFEVKEEGDEEEEDDYDFDYENNNINHLLLFGK